MKKYFTHNGTEQKGPYDYEEIKILLNSKDIEKETYIWKEGMDNWELVFNLEEFKDLIVSSSDEVKSPEEELVLKRKVPIEKNNNLVIRDDTNWLNNITIITLVASILALLGSVYQYFQTLNGHYIDIYILISLSGIAFMSVLLSFPCVIYLIRKKRPYLKGTISIIVGISSFLLSFKNFEYYDYFQADDEWYNETTMSEQGLIDEPEEIIQIPELKRETETCTT
jgi:hypothetical protein